MGEKTRILIVEDETLVARHIQNMVGGLGYEVVGVTATGEEAVTLALKTRPELVLMDIMLRGPMDGIAAAREIWQSLGVPIVYLTAYADESTLHRAKLTQPFGYLLKPFEERELYTAIEMALYKHDVDRRLQERERWLSTILGNIADGVLSTDRQDIVNYLNPVAETLLGRSREECLGRPLAEAFPVESEETGQRLALSIQRIASEDAEISRPTPVRLHRGPHRIPVAFGAALIRDERGEIDGSVLVFRDITRQRQYEDQLKFLAIHDSLTGLPNRILFKDHVTLALAAAARRSQRLAVLVFDLDRFKMVNDTHGHPIGDALLVQTGERLRGFMRSYDTVARQSGDEFMILLTEIPDATLPGKVATRILAGIRAPFLVEGLSITVTASIGIGIYPEDGGDFEALYKSADAAMYEAKEAGRDTFRAAAKNAGREGTA
jgi:diguanylate cyclase (GGDEF)-like protein/PAS domain S-box-containing protein